MKKKITILSLLITGSWAFSQCNIIGKTGVNVNEIETYTSDTEAQCPDCYQWRFTGNNAVILDSGTQKMLGLKGAGAGQTILNLTVLTPNGVSQCSKTLEIAGAGSTNTSAQESACDINIKGFKEAKVSDEIIAFFPTSTDNTYNYNWTAIYTNGDIKTSNEKVPQFPYSEKEMPFQTIKLKVVSKKCYKEYTKTYNESFWMFFNK